MSGDQFRSFQQEWQVSINAFDIVDSMPTRHSGDGRFWRKTLAADVTERSVLRQRLKL